MPSALCPNGFCQAVHGVSLKNHIQLTPKDNVMGMVHTYVLVAKETEGETLASALHELGAVLATLPGSQGSRLLRDRASPLAFLFLEFWESEDARKAAGPHLPQAVMGRIMASLDGRPTIASYEDV
jgi:quinol monooxygenase YgiN